MFLKKLIDPKFYIKNYKKYLFFFMVSSVLIFTFGMYLVFFLTPPDYLQGELFKLLYIHVPAAWFSLSFYTFAAVLSALYLIYKNPFFDMMAASSIYVALYNTMLALVTGSIWGQSAWGTCWVWDARLTSMLLLLFIIIGYNMLRNSIYGFERKANISCIFCVIGAVNIPVIKFSVDLWNTLHQPSSVFKLTGPTIAPTMLYPLFVMLCAMLSLNLLIWIMRTKLELDIRRCTYN